MPRQDILLVFDETVARAGADGWIQQLESAGAPRGMYRLGTTLILSESDVDLIHKAGSKLPAPTRLVSRSSDAWLGLVDRALERFETLDKERSHD